MFATSKSADAVYLSPTGDGVADAIDFDGTNDYLSRGSDLIGNVDGKTFTFSIFIWRDSSGVGNEAYYESYTSGFAQGRVFVYFNAGAGVLSVLAKNSSNITVLDAAITVPEASLNKSFLNLLVSVDLSNATNRHVYINDIVQSVTWNAYTNSNIDFSVDEHRVGRYQKCRLAHLYLDYTYRDLSIEANRRLFITADRKPALNQQALNPIIYLPLNDQTQPGLNLGTGGNFALTGTVARSGRGPSQFNVPYSDLDGAADYLSRSSIAGITNSRKITVSLVFSLDSIGGNNIPLLAFGSNTSPYYSYFQVTVLAAAKIIRIIGRAPNGSTDVVNFDMPGTIYVGRNYSVVFSFDLDDVNKRHAYLNGVSAATFNTYSASDVNLSISSVPAYRIGASVYSIASFIDGRLGNVFFDTKYIDLSQPSNLAKFVTGTGIDAKPVDLGANGEKPFGTPPLIYLPMYGNNAGKNYGSGGDFSVQSGPFAGARGPNEFWGNKADFDGSTGYLARSSALTGVSDGETFSCVFSLNADTVANSRGLFEIGVGSTNNSFRLMIVQNGSTLQIYAKDTGGTIILNAQTDSVFSAGVNYSINLMIDLANISNRAIYVNNTPRSVTYTTYTNTQIPMSATSVFVGRDTQPSYFDGKLSEFYFTTDYIDFSQEANRLKFRDCFGSPTNLPALIESGEVPTPQIYMRFDPDNQGKNYGTGGDFVKSGTILDGGQL